MDNKIKGLVLFLIVLLLANGWLFFYNPSTQALTFDPTVFTVSDTSDIKSIKIESVGFTNHLERNNGWSLNQKYQVDPVFINILKNVISQITMSRSLSQQELTEMGEDFQRAIRVEINGIELSTFWVLGNLNRTQTYFLNEDQSEGYVGEISGYSDYLGSIFELTSLQWRDRVILNGNWRSIQRLELDYLDRSMEDLSITFKQDFFVVSGIAKIDSNAVVDYLGLFENLQANERINASDFPRLDSLLGTTPWATLTMEDIYLPEPQQIKIFPRLPNSSIQLVVDSKDEPVIFDKRRLSEILRQPKDFTYN